MNKLSNYLGVLALALLLSACATSGEGVSRTNNDANRPHNVRVIQNPLSLEDFLVQAPGVTVRGNQVRIRGAANPPLFIIDNVRIGNNYSSAVNAVSPQDIESVEVISGPDTAIYGRDGINGVIVITTKRGG